MEQMGNIGKQKRRAKANSDKKNSSTDEAVGKKRLTKEERIRLMEEKKLKKEVRFIYFFVLMVLNLLL